MRVPLIGRSRFLTKSGTAVSADVESKGSNPQIASSVSAHSRTDFASGPIWSSDKANATRPYLDTRPYVGFIPTTPQNDAGVRMDPPVSEPSAISDVPDATLAADPPLEPPGTRSRL